MARITSPRTRSVVAPGAIFVIMAMALTGTAGTAQELGPDGISPQVVGLLRLGIAGPVLLAVSLARRESPRSMPVGPLIWRPRPWPLTSRSSSEGWAGPV